MAPPSANAIVASMRGQSSPGGLTGFTPATSGSSRSSQSRTAPANAASAARRRKASSDSSPSKRAEGIFCGEQVVIRGVAVVPEHSRNNRRLRRIRDFTVPSGMRSFAARS